MNLIDSSLFCGIYIQILNKIERCTRHRVMFGEDVFVPNQGDRVCGGSLQTRRYIGEWICDGSRLTGTESKNKDECTIVL